MAVHNSSADQDAFVLGTAEAGLLLAGPAAPQRQALGSRVKDSETLLIVVKKCL